MRQAARSVEVAECAVRWRDAGRRRVRRRRPRGGLSADPPPRRVRVHPPRELPHHDPRRRVVRAAVDLGGAPVLRRGAARATASGSSTTSRSATTARWSSAGWRRSSATGASRSRCARRRTSTPAPRRRSREHPIDLLRRLRFRVTRQHRQPADERRLDVVGVRGARRGVRDRARRDGVADDQRDEERRSPRSTSGCG